MSFLGGPECSTGANPLAQFQKQTASDTSLQRDRLASRNPQLNGFRSQQGLPEDAAFQDFAQQGPQFGGEQMPNNSFHMERRTWSAATAAAAVAERGRASSHSKGRRDISRRMTRRSLRRRGLGAVGLTRRSLHSFGRVR
jgi:hypothetical protein